MPYYENSPEGRAILICQVCKSRCHADVPKRVYVPAGEGNYVIKECPICVCHECVQLADDPIRKKLAPMMLDQTRRAPFSIEHAMKGIAGVLGLRDPAREKRRISQETKCGCGRKAKSKCLSCEEPMCGGCLEGHEC